MSDKGTERLVSDLDTLTKRELFAALAIIGVAGNISVADAEKVASAAREFADALIAELDKR